MLRFTLITTILALPFCALAQDTTLHHKLRNLGSELYFHIGGEVANFPGINGSLRQAGPYRMPALFVEGGFGLAIRYRQFLLGVDEGLLGGSNPSIAATGFYDRFYLSTNLIHIGNCILSPQLGYLYRILTVRIPKFTGATNFEDALNTGANSLQLNHVSDLLDVGVELKIKGAKPNQVLPVVRAGYRYGLEDAQWTVSNSTVTDGPRDRGSNVYMELLLGFGY
jgi:hypothetical protein